jgi:hypothetical protein
MHPRSLFWLPLLLIACAGGAGPDEDAGTSDSVPDEIVADSAEDAPAAMDSVPEIVPDVLDPEDVPLEDLVPDVGGEIEPPPEVFDLLDVDEDLLADVPWDLPADVPPDAPPGDVSEEIFEYAWQPDGPCGTPSYDWLPPSEVGEVLSWEHQLLYSLPPELIQMLLAEQGYPDLIQVTYGTRVYKIRYVTQDHGVAREATAMVAVPDVPAEELPYIATTILFLHPTMGFANKCAPSSSVEGAAAALLPAALGFIGVAPDYLGMCGAEEPCEDVPHPYLIGEPTAVASWDSVRAAHALLELIDDVPAVIPDGQVVPWGFSQGGHAALFTDRYGPVYAPEFEVPCTLAVVPPGDLAGQAFLALDALDGAAKLGTGFMVAAAIWYAPAVGAASLFNANGPKDYATWLLEVFPTTCSSGKLVEGAQYIDDLYNPDFLLAVLAGGLEAVDPWGCIALENSITSAPPPYLGTSKLLYLIAQNDELVDNDVERAAAQQLCDAGVPIDFMECAGGSHVGTAESTIGYQVTWLYECLAGVGPADDEICVIDDPVDCDAL